MIPKAAEIPDARCTWVTEFWTVARYICGSSVWNLLYITVVAAGIFMWLVDLLENVCTAGYTVLALKM
jgi:hypothetical protein